jgi:hypothetical protein
MVVALAIHDAEGPGDHPAIAGLVATRYAHVNAPLGPIHKEHCGMSCCE